MAVQKRENMEEHSDTNEQIQKFKKKKFLEQKGKQKNKDGPKGGDKKGLKRKAEGDGGLPDWIANKKVTDADGTTKTDWTAVKAAAKENRLKHTMLKVGNETYTLGVKSKQIWEELRQSKVSKERKMELCKELWGMLKGHAKELIFAHDTVRVLETLLAAGGETYRTALFEELKDDIVEMSKNKYSRFFVLKILRYGSRPQRDFVISALKGKVVTLMKHKTACEVVELAYNDYANAKQRALMTQEFYGPSFKLFPEEDIRCLEDALKKYPEKRELVLKDMKGALETIIDKGVFTNTMIHTLMRDYIACCDNNDRNEIIEALRENLLPIIHSKDGARVAMMCLWHQGPKGRKVILKSFRTHFVKMAVDPQMYLVILAALDCVDDTKFLNSLVVGELMAGLPELVASDSGLRVLRYIVAPRNPTFFHPDIIAQLKPGDGNEFSKKDPELRRSEIQGSASNRILSLLKDNMKTWAFNANWALLIGVALDTLRGEYLASTLDELAGLCQGPFEKGDEGHVLEVAHSSKMLTHVIKGDKARQAQGRAVFSLALLKKVGQDMVSWVGSNRGCFMLVNMLETGLLEVEAAVKELLHLAHDDIATQNTSGSKILLKKLKEL